MPQLQECQLYYIYVHVTGNTCKEQISFLGSCSDLSTSHIRAVLLFTALILPFFSSPALAGTHKLKRLPSLPLPATRQEIWQNH
jgi:hypothetical protein